ncbi:MAG TPA: protein kinase, partial [Polyangiales bacterium]
MSEWDQSTSLLGTDRFVIERRLGEGSMGAVYLAFDRERKVRVALKTLRRVDALGIYRFKREFRTLCDLSHPNLVTLHELFSEGDQWFFTMEYIEGKDFLTYVLGRTGRDMLSTPLRGSDSWQAREAGQSHDTGEQYIAGLELLFPSPLRDAEALRSVLSQVAQGLQAVHAVGKLHRDLKPDNVLVTNQGRAVLLDFGIVGDDARTTYSTLEPGVLGTPAYMSPEQATGKPVDEASDWYGLGVMLYEALTGTIPFDGTYTEVLQRKQQTDPQPPRLVVSGVPPDLDELCVSLLARDPRARPRGAAVLRVLQARKGVAVEPTLELQRGPDGAAPFVGRAPELAELRQCLADSDGGRPVVALVSGPSGIGKTTLVERFVDESIHAGTGLVLKGRCYERESVPFKAIDSLVDSLSHYLRRLPPVHVAEVMPRDIVALSQLFPVLKRVEEISQAKRRGALPSDPKELRRRAFTALKELFSRVADRDRLVLFIDDLQWGDVDSAKLLYELVTGSDCPAVMLLCAFRQAEVDTSPCLRTLLGQLRESSQVDMREITLSGLSQLESLDLARTLLGTRSEVDATRVGEEGQGSPYLLTELVRYVHAAGTQEASVVSLEHALEARLSSLSKDARTLLQLVSVAGRPVPEDTLALASAFDINLQTALAELRAAKLVRGVATRSGRAVEIYHDRVREAVVSRMAPELLSIWHRRLASTLEASGSLDLEALADHLLGAGEGARAGLYASRAAAQAERALAFDKAARLYAIAVVHHEQTEAEKRELMIRWCDALVHAGRGAQAARVYLEASQLSEGEQAAELRRRAGVQLVLGGHIEEGVEILRENLRELGLNLAADFPSAWREVMELQARLLQRGLAFSARDPSAVRPALLQRLDALWSVTLGLLITEVERPLPLLGRYLLEALDVGEPERVMQGLCLYQAFVEGPRAAYGGGSDLGVMDAAVLLERSRSSAHASAWLAFARACDRHRVGAWQAALSELETAEELFVMQAPGGVNELRLCRQLMASIYMTFSVVDGLRAAQGWAHEAEERDDLLVATRLRLMTSLLSLVRDDVVAARRTCSEAMARWNRTGLDLTALSHWAATATIDLYERDRPACERHQRDLDEFLRAPFAFVPVWRSHVLLLRAL